MSRTLIRYWTYDQCLQNSKIKYTWKDLLERANKASENSGYEPINKTQFYNDIKKLKQPPYLAPIATYKENGLSYYFYTDEKFSLKNQGLNELEAEQIKSALMVLSRFKGMPQFDWVHEVIPKIEQQFGFSNESSEVIGFDENVDLKGMDHFGVLFNAILYKKVIHVAYRSFKASATLTYTISPYFLKQYNNRWFLLGQDPTYTSLTTFSLDRIEGISEIPGDFVPNTQYDFNEYFEDIIGVTKPAGAECETIKMWFSPSQSPYIQTKPIHGTQRQTFNQDGSSKVTAEVIPNFELEQLILSYGENCKVLEPEDLRVKIEKRLKEALGGY